MIVKIIKFCNVKGGEYIMSTCGGTFFVRDDDVIGMIEEYIVG